MEKLEIYLQQHNEIAHVIQEAYDLLNPAALAKDAVPIVNLLAKLEDKLMSHLKLEDVALYPKLFESKDELARALAAEVQADTMSLRALFEEFIRAWKSAPAIERSPQDFVVATKQLFQVIARRINRENNQLFPVIDRLT